jgi:uncharacterized LabA/DUF88 family protein
MLNTLELKPGEELGETLANILQPTNRLRNAMAYIDFENISELLKKSGHDPLEMNFFKVIPEKLKEAGLNIIDIIVFGNFEKNTLNGKQQTILRALGLQTRQASNNGKNSSDLELMANALRDLFRNPNIDVFVIVSSDRDIIPLLKEIRYENKHSFIITTRNGFNPTVIKYADSHEYIEDIFKLTPPDEAIVDQDAVTELIKIDPATVGLAKVRRAREVARYFYKSHIWTQASILGKPVHLKGYLDVIIRAVKRSSDDILNDFKLAHCLKYITIYQHPARGLCLKEGEQMKRLCP